MSRYLNRLPRTYDDARRMLNGRGFRTVANNTRLVAVPAGQRPVRITLEYHGNVIAGWTEDGTAQFQTAGWGTPSTRDRLNAMIPARARFFQKDHGNYVTDGERTIPSHDAILTVLPDGTMDAR